MNGKARRVGWSADFAGTFARGRKTGRAYSWWSGCLPTDARVWPRRRCGLRSRGSFSV